MTTVTENFVREPIGRIMSGISRLFLMNLQNNLSGLDIGRSFYPLLLIEAGNGQLTQNELAEKLSSNKVQVVRIINYLSSKGYVERMRNSSDRRKARLEITDKARKYLPGIKNALQETTELALKDIPLHKAEELYNLLMQIDKNLSLKNGF